MRRRPRLDRPPNASGNVAIEYGLLLPALLFFVLGIIDTGRLLWSYAALAHGVDAAARCGAVDGVTCGTASQITAYAADQSYGLTIAASAFSAVTASCGVQVTGNMTFVFIIPWVAITQPGGTGNSITLSATACDPQ